MSFFSVKFLQTDNFFVVEKYIAPLQLRKNWKAKQSRKIFGLAERRWTFDGRWGCHIRIGQCKAVRKITFLATPIVTPRASTRGALF